MLIETIRINRGVAENLPLHEARAFQSAKILFHEVSPFSFAEVIAPPSALMQGISKCRITYSDKILNVAYEAYTPKKITTIALVDAYSMYYNLKFADRSQINELKESTTADDILMVSDGRLTDLSYANIALQRRNKWYTPIKPMLAGTRRHQLIQANILTPEDIFFYTLYRYSAIKPINAMLDFHETPALYIKKIDSENHLIHLSEEP